MKVSPIKTLFLDIGGVLLTNGWGLEARTKTAAHFKLNLEELNERHHLAFDAYEQGKLTLSEYLKRIVFYEKRSFFENDFVTFMLKQSTAHQATIDYFKQVKKFHHIKIIAVSNEGRELNAFRIKEHKLFELFDAFISSCFVHVRKPDPAIFTMAVDVSQTLPEQILFIDDRPMFVEVAQSLGIHAIHHQGLEETKNRLKKFGLSIS
jgi:putative hydrolase of the HAD superfamily